MSAKLQVNGDRLWQSLMDMAQIGATAAGGSCRVALTDEDKAGRDLFIEWCRDAGCDITIDQIGNIFARRPGANPDLPAIATGSHLDTQPKGGKFDGVYGVLAGLEVVRSLNDHAITTTAPIDIIVWTNEEGCRFAPAMLASGVHAGIFTLDYALARTDADGLTLGDELRRIGYAGDLPCGTRPLRALLEAHIEQGPVLEANSEVIGAVTGGQGQMWFDVTVEGQDAHAGSTPMANRRDAMTAAARLVLAVETIANDHPPHGVGTVGEVRVSPNSRNTIPGAVEFSVDLRHPDAAALAAMRDALNARAADITKNCRVSVKIAEIWHNPAIRFDAACIAAVRHAGEKLGYPTREMVSGAGHDACQVARTTPTGMIFVPCDGGISHNEAENASPEHLMAGCNVLLHAIMTLDGASGGVD